MELKPNYTYRKGSWSLDTFNRTLWNWNFRITLCVRTYAALLIEPYGIETDALNEALRPFFAFNRTSWNWNHFMSGGGAWHLMLLIEPYGIETRRWCARTAPTATLLIEPYGIETNYPQPAFRCFPNPFNRTLWNWNELRVQVQQPNDSLLIEPYGIETVLRPPFAEANWVLLIEPYGIETGVGGTVISHPCALLIEPYGIETGRWCSRSSRRWWPFNRTLWNWNGSAWPVRAYLPRF